MSDVVQNPFATPAGAARYGAGRPFHHPRALNRILGVVGHDRIGKALDVACGTGLSTVALADRSALVVGVDSVEAMVHLASRARNTLYAVAAAEDLPFGPDTFDLLTVSSGVHWFDQQAFFSEAARILVPGGWVGIYDHFFQGSADEPAIDAWLRDAYAQRYPPPPRTARVDAPLRAPKDFLEVEAFEYEDLIPFAFDELISYLLSHSNTIAPATEGRETHEETEAWLRRETGHWFNPPARRTFRFRGVARCLRLTI